MIKSIVSLIVLLIFCSNSIFAQALPVIENFTYSNALTANGWLNYPSVGVNIAFPATTANAAGLTFPGYLQSGIGNAALLKGDGEDVYKPFSSQTSGSVYAAAMIKVDSAPIVADGEYFFHFYGKNTGGTNYQYCRFYIKDAGGTSFVVAVNKTTKGALVNGANVAPIIYNPTSFPYGTTIFVVLKYEFVPTTNPDDPVYAYVFDAATGIPSVEPVASSPGTIILGPVTAGAAAAGDAGELLGISLRRSDSYMKATVDGIRVTKTWAQVLPVSLTRFEVKAAEKNTALLTWEAALEKDQPIYTVQHSSDGVNFEDIFVQKSEHNTAFSMKKYQHEVRNLRAGKHYFRLKMTDNTNWKAHSATETIQIKGEKANIFFANNQLNISYLNEKDLPENAQFNIVNEEGKVLKSFPLLQFQQVDLSDLPTAVYFVHCPQEEGVQGFKFFK